jgi:hypothetical protein
MYQKGVYYSGIKIFNGLPKAINDVSSKPNKFKIVLKHFVHNVTTQETRLLTINAVETPNLALLPLLCGA